MFSRFIVFIVVLQTATLIGCQSNGGAEPATTSADVNVESDRIPPDARAVVLYVEGLSCPLCASNLEKELRELPSVVDVMVDLDTGAVRVPLKGAPLPTKSQLLRIVVDSGFSLRSVQVE